MNLLDGEIMMAPYILLFAVGPVYSALHPPIPTVIYLSFNLETPTSELAILKGKS